MPQQFLFSLLILLYVNFCSCWLHPIKITFREHYIGPRFEILVVDSEETDRQTDVVQC